MLNFSKFLFSAAINVAEDLSSIQLVSVRYSELERLTRDDKELVRGYKFHLHRAEHVYATVFTPTCSVVTTSAAATGGAADLSDDEEEADDSEFLALCKPRFYDLIDQYENALTVHLTLPVMDRETLDRFGVPSAMGATSTAPTGIGT